MMNYYWSGGWYMGWHMLWMWLMPILLIMAVVVGVYFAARSSDKRQEIGNRRHKSAQSHKH